MTEPLTWPFKNLSALGRIRGESNGTPPFRPAQRNCLASLFASLRRADCPCDTSHSVTPMPASTPASCERHGETDRWQHRHRAPCRLNRPPAVQRANGDGTVYQLKDSRWEAAGYVLAPGNTRKRIRVYGTRREALAKLTGKIANINRGVPRALRAGQRRCPPDLMAGGRRHPPAPREHPHPLHHVRQPVPQSRPGQKEARQAHRQRHPHLAQPAPHYLPVLRPQHRRRARSTPLLRRRNMLLQAPLTADAGIHPLRAQVRLGVRRPRRGDLPQRRPQRAYRHTPASSLRTTDRRRGPPVPRRRDPTPFPRPVRTRSPHRTPRG